MSGVPDEIFDPDDYLHFHEEVLTAERADAETELIVRLLELREGDEVLDVACGHGRLAVPLAARGLQVTGLDRSRPFLELAAAAARERGVAVELVEGDMRSLPWESRFDALVNWYTSFGYFEDDDANRAVLRGFAGALKPGGRAILELHDRDALARRVEAGATVWVAERGDDLMIDRVTFDPAAGRSETERIVVRDGQVRRTRFSLRVLAASELRDWLLEAGFHAAELFDEYGKPYGAGARRLIAVARA
jgi:SAM-dependent methyltransferase